MIDSSNKSSHVDNSDEKADVSNENLSKLKEVDSSDENDSTHV